jgi:hypothetical protein
MFFKHAMIGLVSVTACGGAAPPVERVSLPAPTCNCPVAPVSAPVAARSPELDELAQRRLDAARKRIPVLHRLYERGLVSATEMYVGYRDIAVAARESGLRGEALRSILTEYRDKMAELRDHERTRFAAGAESEDGPNHAEVLLAEAEYWLAEAKTR